MGDYITTALNLLKIDMGITHNERDAYFRPLIISTISDLSSRGIDLDLSNTEDMFFLVDFVAFNYKNRNENKAMPQNLLLRFRNRQMRKRAMNND